MRSLPQRVAFLGFNDPRTHTRGTENVIRFQAEAFDGRAYYVFRGSRAEVFRWGKLIAVSLPHAWWQTVPALWHLLRRFRGRSRTILVHGHSYLLSLWVWSDPLVFTVHDALAYAKRAEGSHLAFLFGWIERAVYRRAHVVHAISRFAWSQAAGAAHFEGKCLVIPNTTARSTPPCRSTAPAARAPYLLVVRSMEARANIELILDLAQSLQDDGSPQQVLLAGKGPLLSRYRDLAERRELRNVQFLGYVNDDALHDLYCGAECVVLPALYGEGFGLPLIEAYARGVGAIGSDVCAVPEVIADEALLFSNDVASLRRAISHAGRLERTVYMNHFEANFGRSRILGDYRRLYQAATAASRT